MLISDCRKMAPLFSFISDREDTLSVCTGLKMIKDELKTSLGILMNPANIMVIS